MMSWKSIFRVLLAITVVWLWLRVWQLVLAIIVSILAAVAMAPAMFWLERRGWRRTPAAICPVLALALTLIGFIALAGDSIANQAHQVVPRLAALGQQIAQSVPWLRQLAETGNIGPQQLATFAASLVKTAAMIVVGLILTVFLLIEHERTISWTLSVVPLRHREKVRVTLHDARSVTFGYVAGNAATSVFASIFVFVALTILHVPGALFLAFLAGIADFIPVVGIVLAGVPAVLMATTVSLGTAVEVAALYLAYHGIESYLIAPRIYGGKLCLSHLAVILAFAVGGEVGGVIGAILAMPIAALYPTIERIWLKDYLDRDAILQHERLYRAG